MSYGDTIRRLGRHRTCGRVVPLAIGLLLVAACGGSKGSEAHPSSTRPTRGSSVGQSPSSTTGTTTPAAPNPGEVISTTLSPCPGIPTADSWTPPGSVPSLLDSLQLLPHGAAFFACQSAGVSPPGSYSITFGSVNITDSQVLWQHQLAVSTKDPITDVEHFAHWLYYGPADVVEFDVAQTPAQGLTAASYAITAVDYDMASGKEKWHVPLTGYAGTVDINAEPLTDVYALVGANDQSVAGRSDGVLVTSKARTQMLSLDDGSVLWQSAPLGGYGYGYDNPDYMGYGLFLLTDGNKQDHGLQVYDAHTNTKLFAPILIAQGGGSPSRRVPGNPATFLVNGFQDPSTGYGISSIFSVSTGTGAVTTLASCTEHQTCFWSPNGATATDPDKHSVSFFAPGNITTPAWTVAADQAKVIGIGSKRILVQGTNGFVLLDTTDGHIVATGGSGTVGQNDSTLAGQSSIGLQIFHTGDGPWTNMADGWICESHTGSQNMPCVFLGGP